jgi:phage shock protein A
MGFLEVVVLRLVFWVGLPLGLLIFAVGPQRLLEIAEGVWRWVWSARLNPESVLTKVLRSHTERIKGLRVVLARTEAAEAQLVQNIEKSHKSVSVLQAEAQDQAIRGDDLGARAALYKLNLERLATRSFEEQLVKQRAHVTDLRRRLYLLELQLRQYEVGRSILLSELAEAQTVEQQYAIANNFDPFSAVANWQQAEGLVQEKAENARVIEQVYADVAEIPLAHEPAQVDPAALDAQLAELKAMVAKQGTVTQRETTTSR